MMEPYGGPLLAMKAMAIRCPFMSLTSQAPLGPHTACHEFAPCNYVHADTGMRPCGYPTAFNDSVFSDSYNPQEKFSSVAQNPAIPCALLGNH